MMWSMSSKKHRFPNPNLPRQGEMPFKQYCAIKGKEIGITGIAYWHRLDRGTVPRPKMRKVNARVIYVKNGGAT